MPCNLKLIFTTMIWLTIATACSGMPAPAVLSTATPPVSRATATPLDHAPNPASRETATVAQVVDGDTIELADGRRVRYIGMNTPERDQPYYQEATQANRQLVANKTIQLEFDTDTFDRYGRTLAYVWVGGVMANLEIVRNGFANTFTVPPNVRYDADFRAAEQQARAAGRGLWAAADVPLKIITIHANAPGNDNENPNGEWIEIANQGAQPVQLRGYTLKDAANHIYTFGNFTVNPNSSFRLYSGSGPDNAQNLYWGFTDDSVWNNDSDSAFLRDAAGALVDSYAY